MMVSLHEIKLVILKHSFLSNIVLLKDEIIHFITNPNGIFENKEWLF